MGDRGHCPDCHRAGRDSLREITPTGESIGQWGTAKWWLIVMHSDGSGGICPGSGKRV